MDITLTKITQFSGHKDAIYTLVYHKKDKYAISAGADGMVVQWDIYGDGNGKLLANVENTIYSMHLDESENELLLVTRSGELIQIDLLKKNTPKRVIMSKSPIFSILKTEHFLYIGDEKGTLYQLNHSLELLKKKEIGTKSIRQIISTKNSIYIGTSNHEIMELNSEFKILERMVKAHENSIFSLAIANKQLWSGSRDARIHIWESNELVKEIQAHKLHVNSLDYNPNNGLMLSGSMDKSVKIWDTKKQQLIKVLNKEKCSFHISSVNKVLWIGTNEFISCGDDRMVIYTEIDIK